MIRFSLVTRNRAFHWLGLALATAGLASCKRLTERVEITETREISSYAHPSQPEAPSRVRFFDDEPEAPPPPTPQQLPLIWDTPAGWKEGPPDATGMRFINLVFGPNGEGECYFSVMPGAAGGVEANVNRWRTQMGLPALTPEEIEKLPTKLLFGRDAKFVNLEGDFKSVAATESKKGYRMIGLVQPTPEFTLFVKMTGPKDIVTANEAAFEQFSQSIAARQ